MNSFLGSERHGSTSTLISDVCWNTKEYIFVALSYLVCADFLDYPKEASILMSNRHVQFYYNKMPLQCSLEGQTPQDEYTYQKGIYQHELQAVVGLVQQWLSFQKGQESDTCAVHKAGCLS